MQDYRDLEWIFVDDGSSDATEEILHEYARLRNPPGTVIRHETNQGLSRTLNDAIRHATGSLLLILHQDIELLGSDWISRAVSRLLGDSTIGVVTCYYGIPATDALTFVKRAFGFLRQQFHRPSGIAEEFVTFTEFKCDLIRRSHLEAVGGFPMNYRICGEDLEVSYRLRRAGSRIVKVNTLRAVQRFSRSAETLRGNIHKEFRFGESIAGVLLSHRGFPFSDLRASRYARRRSLHRASQPIVAGIVILFALLAILLHTPLLAIPSLSVLAARYVAYAVRLWPDFRSTGLPAVTGMSETLAAAFLGILSDFVYSLGVATGFVRSAYGAPL